MIFKVALLQIDSQDDKDANLTKIAKMIDEAAEKHADFIAMPEFVNYIGGRCGFIENAEDIPDGETSELFSRKACFTELSILCIIFITKELKMDLVKTELNIRVLEEYLLTDFFLFLDVSEKTMATYRRALKQLFSFLLRSNISNPTYDDIILFKKTLEARNCKSATIALYLAAARRFFSWCEQKNIFPNIAVGVKAPRQERGHKRDFLGAKQLKLVLNTIERDTLKGKRNYAIMALMSVGGLRTIEVIRANVEDMRRLGDFTVLYVQGKGKKDRTEFVKLPEPVFNAINEYLRERDSVDEKDPLFISTSNRNKNRRLTTRTISGIAKQAMRTAGFDSPRLSAHSLRHSAVTLSLLAGADLADVQAFARHSSITTTQIYSHAVDRINSSCENAISDAIFS